MNINSNGIVLIFILILTFNSFRLFSQVQQSDPDCSTPDLDSATAVNLPYYNNNQILDTYLSQNGYDDLEYISFPSPNARVSTFLEPVYLIPLNIYIYRDNDNNPNSSITEAEARNFVCMANEIYRNAGTAIQFYTNRVEFDPSNTFNSGITTSLNVYNMWANKRIGSDLSKGINIHFIRYNGGSENNFGKASLPYYPVLPFAEFSLYVRTHFIPSGGQRGDGAILSTLIHELGHTLSLLHTHHPGRLPSLIFNEQNGTISNGCYQESVSRTRENKTYQGCFATGGLKKCEINGDFLCDTDADPRQSLRVTNCIYNHPASGDYRVDNWNVLWTPPTNNIMSYTTADCRNEFSRSQIAIMWMEMPSLENVIDYDIPEIISAPGQFCYGTSRNFTLEGTLPNDAFVTWAVEPSNLVNQSIGTGFSANLTPKSTSSSGLAQITFSLTGPGNCYIARIQKSFQIGKINSNQVSFTGSSGVCPGSWVTYNVSVDDVDVSSYPFQWIKPSNWSIVYQSATSITLSVPNSNPDGGAVRVRWNNGCGYSNYTGITVYPYPCGGYYSVYPNPASGTLNVAYVEEDFNAIDSVVNSTEFNKINPVEIDQPIEDKTNKNDKEKITIELLTDYGELKYQATTKEKNILINTDKLPRGFYLLRIITSEEIDTRHILLQ